MHPVAWFLWLAGAAMAASATRNPLYLVLLLAIFGLVGAALRRPEAAPVPVRPLRFALVVVPLAAVVNGLLARFGATVLLRLPRRLPLLGGPITAEALVYGAINGLLLAALYAAFTVLNRALPVRDVIRFIPRAFYPVAVVISVAVTFVPTTLRQLRQIREAQAIRGHRMRGLRDWLPLFMPLLVGGMERALQLAEAMTARGFAAEAGRRDALARLGVLAGMTLALVGVVLRAAWDLRALGPALLALGVIALLAGVWRAGRGVRRTVYRRASWTPRDWATVAGVLVALLAFLLLGRATRGYVPYPALTPPPFDPLVGVALLGFVVPALLTPAER